MEQPLYAATITKEEFRGSQSGKLLYLDCLPGLVEERSGKVRPFATICFARPGLNCPNHCYSTQPKAEYHFDGTHLSPSYRALLQAELGRLVI